MQKAVRVRSTREGPLSHITTYVPADIARQFGRRELAKKPILVLLEEAGVQASGARTRPSPRAWPTTCWPSTWRSPSARRCWPCAAWSTTTPSRPVQWLHGFYRPDRYTYEMQLSRVGSIDAKVWVSKDVSAQFN